MNVDVTIHELPALPSPKPGDSPVFEWDIYAEVRCGEIHSVVKRGSYWDERDARPLEAWFEAYIDGLPDSAGVADVVATHPDVFEGLSAVAAKAAELLKGCSLREVL